MKNRNVYNGVFFFFNHMQQGYAGTITNLQIVLNTPKKIPT